MGKTPRLSRRELLVSGPLGLGAVFVACQDDPLSNGPTDRVRAETGPRDGPWFDDAEADLGELDADDGSVDGGEPSPDSDSTVETDGSSEEVGPDSEVEDAGPRFDPQTLPEAAAEYPLGIAAGDPSDGAMILWTQNLAAAELELWFWPEDEVQSLRSVQVLGADGGFFKAEVTGLLPSRHYRYAFVRAGLRSPIGRFRTTPDVNELVPIVIGASACTSNTRSRFGALEAAGARTDLDLFLLLGDTTYNDGAENRAEYRQRWAQNLGKQGYRSVRASTAVLATWDDHEVGNNWSPESIDPSRLSAATEAFFEHLPVRRDPAAPNRLWHQVRIGAGVEVFVLDGRSERRPSTRGTASEEYLSRAQMDWLKDSLASSTAVFKLIMNSVPIAEMPSGFNLGSILLDPADRWQGYASARQDLLTFIEGQNISGVVFVSGDFHLAYSGRVSPNGPGSGTLEVLAGPGAQTANPLYFMLNAPQFDFRTAELNYLALHIDPSARSITLRYHDEDGREFAVIPYSFA